MLQQGTCKKVLGLYTAAKPSTLSRLRYGTASLYAVGVGVGTGFDGAGTSVGNGSSTRPRCLASNIFIVHFRKFVL